MKGSTSRYATSERRSGGGLEFRQDRGRLTIGALRALRARRSRASTSCGGAGGTDRSDDAFRDAPAAIRSGVDSLPRRSDRDGAGRREHLGRRSYSVAAALPIHTDPFVTIASYHAFHRNDVAARLRTGWGTRLQ